MSESAWDEIGFIDSSKYRRTVVKRLQDGPATPSTIAEELDGPGGIAHVSRSLQELREREIVALLVSEETKKGRIYGLTDDGEELAEKYAEFAE